MTAPSVQPTHAVERYLTLADAALIIHSSDVVPEVSRDVSFPLPDGAPLGNALDPGEDFILIHPVRSRKK